MRYHYAQCALCVFWALTPAYGNEPEPDTLSIIPRPAQMERLPGEFPLLPTTPIVVFQNGDDLRDVANELALHLHRTFGLQLTITSEDGLKPPIGSIVLTKWAAPTTLGQEGYELIVRPDMVVLRAPHVHGLFHSVQTLRQMTWRESLHSGRGGGESTAPRSIPCVRIVDEPRYRWRGMLLDCCRHFMDKEFVKRYIDLLAYHKMNVLHWHLTEDQGWRIEIKKHPRLTEIGAWRGTGDQRHGGFYTQEDIREIVAYAADRHITVVPEIEMPGHSVAALASYPELSCTGGPFEVGTRWGVYEDVYCAGNDRTFAFLEDVLSEVIELFPSPYIHIGGDECPKKRWEACSKCQSRIQAEGLANEDELQSYFVRRIEKFLSSKGRRLIGWDEILEGGLAPNATVQSWRGLRGAIAAASAGHDVISSPTSHCYLDYAQLRHPSEPIQMGFIDLETVYSFEPTPPELDANRARHVLGAEGNMWTEHAPQHRVDHQVFPRLCALAEVTWTPARLRDWSDFQTRMKTHYRRLDTLDVTYFIPPPRCDSTDTTFVDTTEVALSNPFDRGTVHITLDGSEPTRASQKYVRPLRLTESTVVKARTFLENGRSAETVEFKFVKQRPGE